MSVLPADQQIPSIKLMLRKSHQHESCGSLPFSHGERTADLSMLQSIVTTLLGEEARISTSRSAKYPDPEATAEFVIDLPKHANLDATSEAFRSALLQLPLQQALLARRAGQTQEENSSSNKPGSSI